MKNKYNITPIEGIQEVVIRHGDAIPFREAMPINVNGYIDSPSKWVEKKGLEPNKCRVEVNKDSATIKLFINEADHISDTITGMLIPSVEVHKFGINEDKVWSTSDLAKFIKMNRSYFESSADAAMLVTTLKDFKGKINTILDKKEDDRANRSIRFEQAVENNIPDGFMLNIPMFKGGEKIPAFVEIVTQVSGNDIVIYLVSPAYKDASEAIKNELIDNELEKLKDFVIIVK